MRLWLAAAMVGVTLAAPPVAADLARGLALAGGLATRLAALILLIHLGMSASAGDALPYQLALAVLVVGGAGPASIDGLIGAWLQRSGPPADRSSLSHVVVIGGGFGGIATVRGLRRAACRITLIDKCNHHLFQPLLYQVATAGLSPADIATPVRMMVRGQANVRVMLGTVIGVDPVGKSVLLERGRIDYDYLVIATGARHSYFGRDEWAAFAPGLKTVDDATAVRRRLLLAFEEAESTATEAERLGWLTFVIVGGGPTGVELAGALAELARYGMVGEFRDIDPASARIVLVQSAPRLLPAFPATLSDHAAQALRALGVELRLDSRVETVSGQGVTVSGETLEARTVLWAAGVMASPAASWLGVTADRAGRVPVGPDLCVIGRDAVYAVGDTAASDGWGGQPVPGLVPAAKQGGAFVARVIARRLAGRAGPARFRYRHLGNLATIGRAAAVADFGSALHLRGVVAWWLWGAAHVAFLVGGRNRASVLAEWLWAYLTFRRSTRLITGE